MTKYVPREIHGSILQFLPLKNVPFIAKTHHILPEIFLSYHSLDNFLDKIRIWHISSDSLNLMLYNTSYPKESLLLYVIRSSRLFLCEHILKNNQIDFKKIYDNLVGCMYSSSFITRTILNLLIDYGFNPDTKQLVSKLIDTGNTDILKILVENDKIDVSKYGVEVFNAVTLGYFDVLKCFVEAGLDPSFDNNKPMYEAIRLGNYNIVKYLLKQKNVSDTLNINRALESVCQRGDYQHYLIAKKLSLWTDPSFSHNTCLSKATIAGNYETVKMLLSFEEVNPADNNNQAIIWASQCNSIVIVNLLLSDKRVDPRARNNLSLREACEYNKYGIVKALLNWRGPNRERVNPNDGTNGNTALSLASQRGHIQIVKLLLSDARTNPGTNDGIALRVALDNSKEEVAIELLKWRSANDKRIVPHWSTLGSANQNPIVIACRRNLLKVFKILIKDPGVCLYPNIIAQAYKSPEILKILLTKPGISPCVNNNECLHWAISRYQYTSIRLLLKDPRINVNENNGELLLKAIKAISKDGTKKKIGMVEMLLLHNKTEIYGSHLLAIIEKKEYTVGTSKPIDRIFRIDPMYKRGLPVIYALRWKNMGALRIMCKHPNFDTEKVVPDLFKKAFYMNNKEAIDILYKYGTPNPIKLKSPPKEYEILTWGTFRTLLKENNITVSGKRAGELWREYTKNIVHNNSYTINFIKRVAVLG